MHELEMIDKVLRTIEDEAKKQGFTRINDAHLQIGKMNGLEKSYFLDAISSKKEGPLKSSKLNLEEMPVELECTHCKHKYIDKRFDDHHFAHTTSHAPYLYMPPSCPLCHKDGAKIVSGTQMKLVSIDGE